MGAVTLVGVIWLVRYMTTPPPGIKMPDMGQEHVTPAQVAQIQYNSNPPTSGPHLPTWIKPGIYNQPQSEGELIHSLEHGYIIISYNCGVHLLTNLKANRQKAKLNFAVYAHEEDENQASPAADLETTSVATGSAVNETEGCRTLIAQLEELARKKRIFKLIVVPRPNLDTTIALTAWDYIDKFDQFDEVRIIRFIDYHRDRGPEKTMD